MCIEHINENQRPLQNAQIHPAQSITTLKPVYIYIFFFGGGMVRLKMAYLENSW